jgi:phosphoglycolate phosphatase
LPTLKANQYRNEASNGANALLQKGFKEHYQQYNSLELRQQLLDYYQNNISDFSKVFDGVIDMITTLDENNIPWGIVTNKPAFLTTPLLSQFPILANSKINVSGDTLKVCKPHPEPLLYAAKFLNRDVKNIWYVGDALRDIEAGKAANMKTIVAKWGYIAETENCQHWQSDFIFNSVGQLTAHVNQSLNTTVLVN